MVLRWSIICENELAINYFMKFLLRLKRLDVRNNSRIEYLFKKMLNTILDAELVRIFNKLMYAQFSFNIYNGNS